MYNTFIVNIYGGPGTGKSTAAAYIFAKLKMAGINAELVTEYAKEKTWEECKSALNCKYYINAKQSYHIARVFGKVEVIVTDSPILLGAIYTDDSYMYVKDASIVENSKYKDRLDIVLNRNFAYEPTGRNQTEAEAIEIDEKIRNILKETNTKYSEINPNEHIFNDIVDSTIARVMSLRRNNENSTNC